MTWYPSPGSVKMSRPYWDAVVLLADLLNFLKHCDFTFDLISLSGQRHVKPSNSKILLLQHPSDINTFAYVHEVEFLCIFLQKRYSFFLQWEHLHWYGFIGLSADFFVLRRRIWINIYIGALFCAYIYIRDFNGVYTGSYMWLQTSCGRSEQNEFAPEEPALWGTWTKRLMTPAKGRPGIGVLSAGICSPYRHQCCLIVLQWETNPMSTIRNLIPIY